MSNDVKTTDSQTSIWTYLIGLPLAFIMLLSALSMVVIALATVVAVIVAPIAIIIWLLILIF